MGTQNLLNYYGNRLDAKISYDSYYDFYLASDEDNFQREVVYSDNIIGYTEPRTPQVGNVSGVLPLWIDLNNYRQMFLANKGGLAGLFRLKNS